MPSRRLFLTVAAISELAQPALAREAAAPGRPPVPGIDPALDARVKAFLDAKRGDWHRGINLWNVSEAGARFMHELVVARGHRRILDIGTSTGHSALWLGWAAAKTGGRVVTIEIDPERHAEAVRNVRVAGLADYIDARLGDAHQLVHDVPGPWDFVFQDADKSWSLNYWRALRDKLAPGSVMRWTTSCDQARRAFAALSRRRRAMRASSTVCTTWAAEPICSWSAARPERWQGLLKKNKM